jgi:chaperonin GroEL
MRQLARNAGEDGAVIIDTVRRLQKEKNDKNIGTPMTGRLRGVRHLKVIQGPTKAPRSHLCHPQFPRVRGKERGLLD